PTNTAAAGFLFHGSDSGSGVARFDCALDGAQFSACSSGVTYNVADGGHSFAVRAVDGAGNQDPSPATYSWIVDTIAPDTVLDGGPANPSKSATATFVFHGSDVGTGVAKFECAFDVAVFSTCVSGVTYSSVPDGSHTFAVRAVDGAGNVDPSP